MMASMIFIVPNAQAKTADNSLNANANVLQQRRYRRVYVQPRYWRGRRTVNTTRLVRVGYRLYRYTYRTTYNGNGRVISSRLISRVRVR